MVEIEEGRPDRRGWLLRGSEGDGAGMIVVPSEPLGVFRTDPWIRGLTVTGTGKEGGS